MKNIREYLFEGKTIDIKKLEKELGKVKDIDDAEILLKKYGDVRYCDEGIDDGIDDDDSEDEYLMYKSFDVSDGKKSYHITFYYGNNTFEVTDYRINK